MALQGDLNSFALPDVLRLLAGTGKSGRLDVAATTGTGEVVLSGGSIASGSVSSAPHATSASDVVFEILRFGGGTFVFEDGDQPTTDEMVDVESAIADAEALVDEWASVEATVPSMDAWVSLLPEIADEVVSITAERWRALVAVAGGGSVRDLATTLELTDLGASRLVKELVEADLASVRASHGYVPPTVELDSFEEFEIETPTMTEFEDLVAEDRPVVMEQSDDALLPEPLPGEGIAYDGESIVGVVDGRSFESHDEAPEATGFDASEPFESMEPIFGLGEAEPAADLDELESVGDAAPFSELAPEAEFASETSADEEDPSDAETEVDDERGSLLRFLSTVKP